MNSSVRMAVFGAFLATATVPAAAGDWSVSTGAMAGIGPAYEGADRYRVNALPLIDVEWRERLFLSTERGLGGWLFKRDGISLGAALGYEMGRDADLDRDELAGLGDVKGAAQVRLLAGYRAGPLRFDATVARALGGSDGTTVKLGAGMGYPINEKLRLMPGAAIVWADSNYMSSYFGVTAAQAAASRTLLGAAAAKSEYSASAGIKNVDLSLMAMYQLTPKWSLRGGGGMRFLVGDAADSPISKRDAAPFGLVGFGYRW
jgi:MipA family protein